ncbi:MAG: hypothetical protein ACR2HX_08315 [Pyrinomonadaceae bacterium]
MLTETFQSIAIAARNIRRNWQPMLLIAIVYACLLVVLYFFASVREASLAQVVLTFALAITAPLLFFILQAMIAGAASSETEELTSGTLVRKALTSFWKLLLITLPLIALAILIAYLLGKAQTRFGTTLNESVMDVPRRVANAANAREAARPIDWRAATLSTLRYLAFGLVLPLAAIHLWLATAQEGLGPAIRKLNTLLARAFAPQSVLIYVVGFLIFAVIPYFLLFKTISTRHAWLEISLLVARLAIVFALTLFGWVMTVKAISLLSTNSLSPRQPHPANEAA